MKKLLVAAAFALASIAAPAIAQDAKKPAAPDAKSATALVDLNSASEKDLATLPGIGEARAKAIVGGRPYKGKDDLLTKKVVPQSVYDQIKDKVIARQG